MSSEPQDDLEQLLSPAELAAKNGGSIALIRYAIDAGCPTVNGQLSQATFVQWMLQNYALVRTLAGLPALPDPADGDPELEDRAKMGNMLVTITDFIASRASDPEIKKATASLSEFLRNLQSKGSS